MKVVDPKKFRLGLMGMATFVIILGIWLFPIFDQKTGLEWADELFNQLAKNSTYYVPAALKRAEKFRGVAVDIGVGSRWPGADALIAKIVRTNGLSAKVIGDGRVRIEGDLGTLGRAAVADADLLFQSQEQELKNKYGLSGKEVIYYWWTAFEGLTRRYIQENRPAEADFTKFITTRVLEPSYNFAGIQARNISENVTTVVSLLGFYVLYTLWYGFSIFYLFEGLGIKATKAKEKKEA